jgi:hypothetical protein
MVFKVMTLKEFNNLEKNPDNFCSLVNFRSNLSIGGGLSDYCIAPCITTYEGEEFPYVEDFEFYKNMAKDCGMNDEEISNYKNKNELTCALEKAYLERKAISWKLSPRSSRYLKVFYPSNLIGDDLQTWFEDSNDKSTWELCDLNIFGYLVFIRDKSECKQDNECVKNIMELIFPSITKQSEIAKEDIVEKQLITDAKFFKENVENVTIQQDTLGLPIGPSASTRLYRTAKFFKKMKENVKKVTIQKGTSLYRTQPVSCDIELNERYDSDTGKNGVYFSDGIYIALGMILEYNKPMYLCEYVVTENIICYKDKYSFRKLEPDRFYKSIKDARKGKFVPNTDPLKSYNHIDNTLLPMHDIFDDNRWAGIENEIFIIKDDLAKIVQVNSSITDEISIEKAYNIIKLKSDNFGK